MGYMTYDVAQATENARSNGNDVKFFSLKNDGDFAIVRFALNDMNDLEIIGCHEVKINNVARKVNCLRNPNDPVEMCPFCEVGSFELRSKVYVKVFQYNIDTNGNVSVEAKVWERPLKFAQDINNKITTYGAPLSQHMFKVTRNGAAGYNKTTYSIDYLPPMQYPLDKFPTTNAFDNFKALGTIVMDKTADDMVNFVRTGTFDKPTNNTPVNQTPNFANGFNPPMPDNSESLPFAETWANPTVSTPTPQYVNTTVPPQYVNTTTTVPNQNQTGNFANAPVGNIPTRQPMPWENPQNKVATPTRKY